MSSINLRVGRSPFRAILLLALPLFAGACADTGTGTEPQKAVVSATSTSVDLSPGSSTVIVYKIDRLGGHSGAVNLTISGLPQGVTATFHPPVVQDGMLVSSLQITVAPLATPGTYTFTTAAAGNGVEPTAIPVTVNVVIPGITLAVLPPTVALEQGTSIATPVVVTRTGGHTGIVGLSAIGLPNGVTASFAPSALANGETEAIMTLSATLQAVPGTASVTVQANSPGVPGRTVTTTYSITPTTTPAILVSAAPSLMQIIRGQSGQSTINVVRFAGYAGGISLSLTGLPAGISADVPSIAPGANSATMTFTVPIDIPASPFYSLSLRASGDGIQDVVLPISFRVLEIPGFYFSFLGSSATGAVTLSRGGTAFLSVTLLRVTGYDQSVTVSVHGLPEGVTTNLPVVVAPNGFTNQNVNMSFAASPGTAPGVYTLQLRGTGADGLVVESTITLTVQ